MWSNYPKKQGPELNTVVEKIYTRYQIFITALRLITHIQKSETYDTILKTSLREYVPLVGFSKGKSKATASEVFLSSDIHAGKDELAC